MYSSCLVDPISMGSLHLKSVPSAFTLLNTHVPSNAQGAWELPESVVDDGIPPLYKERWTLPPGTCGLLPTPKGIFFFNSIYPSQLNPLTPECLIFWVLGLHLNQDFWLAYWVQHFNCLPFLLFDGFFLFNDFQGLPWHPDYVSARAQINDASSFTARRKTLKVNLISFSFYSSTQRLEENDVKVLCFLCCNKGRICKQKSFFLISVYLFFYKRHSEYGVSLHNHFFVVLNLNIPAWLLLNASPGLWLFLISEASFSFVFFPFLLFFFSLLLSL